MTRAQWRISAVVAVVVFAIVATVWLLRPQPKHYPRYYPVSFRTTVAAGICEPVQLGPYQGVTWTVACGPTLLGPGLHTGRIYALDQCNADYQDNGLHESLNLNSSVMGCRGLPYAHTDGISGPN